MRDVAALLVTALLVLQASGPRIVPDCAMVKPVDPTFHSPMPIVKPDPKVHYTLRIVNVPSCNP